METPFLDFYYEAMEFNMMHPGLCKSDLPHTILGLFRTECTGYWGYDGRSLSLFRGGIINDDTSLMVDINIKKVQYEFTPLRQTIVLLCACISGEY